MKLPIFPFHFSTIRNRLTFWFCVTSISMLTIFAVLVSMLVRSVLNNQIDHHIHTVLTEANQIVRLYTGSDRERLLSQFVSTRGMTVLLLSGDGTPIVQTNSIDLAPMSEHQAEQVLAMGDTATTFPIHFTIQHTRFATIRLGNDLGNGVLAVGYSLEIVDQTLVILLMIIGIVTALFLIPCVVLSSLLIKHSLIPLEAIAQTMEAISEKEELTTRLPEQIYTQELRLITNAFNRMLEKIQAIFQFEQEFFSDAAHALKTPLAVLRSQVEMLDKEPEGKKQMLLSTIDRAVETTQDLLFISRIENTSMRKHKMVSLTSISKELGELAVALGDVKHLVVTTHIEQGIQVQADASLLRRALSNIVHNAITYSPESGEVTLMLYTEKTTKQVLYVVTNEGVGIPKRELELIFTRFYRGVSSKGTTGSGLGLAMSRAVVEQLGGNIIVHSIPQKRTQVIVSLQM